MINNCCFEYIKELYNYDNNILHMMKSCARQIFIQIIILFLRAHKSPGLQ